MATRKSKSSPAYAQGGNRGMAPKTGASPQKPGTTTGASHGSGGGHAKGGSGHMVGKQTAGHCKPL